jgi:prefoldin subunit 5
MAIDNNFADRFQQQIESLESLKRAVEGAIREANEQIKEMRAGKSMEEVLGPVPPKPNPAAQGGGG